MKHSLKLDIISNSPSVGYTPNQIKNAYNLGGTGNGSGIRISVLDFFGNPYIQRNLDTFSSQFSLPKITLSIFDKSSENNFDFSGYIEASADTQWLHAISPFAAINVVRAPSYSADGAISAIRRALEIGTDIMLMTFQSPFQEEYLRYNDVFSEDCVFVASAGDYGAQVNFPSCVPTCISVGGTALSISENGTRLSEETVWEGTGGGICTYYDIPEFQSRMSGISEITNGKRGVPDVSFLADNKTGYSIYHSSTEDSFGWYRAGGTSLSATVIAGIIANVLSGSNSDEVNKKNVISDLYELAGGTRYTNPYGKFIDITEGSNGMYSAMPGYDLCTGLGSLVNL